MSKGTYGGLWFGKLYGSYKVSPEYKVTLQGLYFGDTAKHGDTFGTARNMTCCGATLKNNSMIGWELDLINEFQIYNNLRFIFGGGYVWAGDALDFRRGTSLTNFSPKNPWAIRSRLQYTF